MITVDDASPIPPFEQLRAQLADQIASGELAGGAKLPSVRQLAGDLRIAPGTVARAYRELEAAGLVATSRASGTRVRTGHAAPKPAEQAANTYARTARKAGLTLSQALALVKASW